MSVIFLNTYAYEPLSRDQLESIVQSDTRVITSLAGKWQKSYDEVNWETITLPYSEPNQRTVIYKRSVRIDRDLIENNAWHLYFLGIDHQVEVFINEQFVGKYFGGMAPFNVKIPDRMISGENNTIKFIVSPAKNYARQTRTQYLYAKKIYTGLIREVLLIGTPQIWINDVKYQTKFNEDLTFCNLQSKVKISSGQIGKFLKDDKFRDTNDNLSSASRTKIYADAILINKQTGDSIAKSDKHNFSIESERTITKDFNFSVSDFKLWSPESPDLYELKVRIWKNDKLIDNYRVNIGFRKFSYIKDENSVRFYLNNEPFEMKGVTYAEDYVNDNQTLAAERLESDIELMKTLGANIIRSKFSPPHPYLVNLCDSKGILLFIELPIYDIPAPIISLNEIQVHIENIGKQILDSYSNHTSVAAWGISEGLQEGTAPFKEFSSQMIKLFKENSDKMIYKIIPFGASNIDLNGIDLLGIRTNRTSLKFSEISNEVIRIKNIAKQTPIFTSYGVPIQTKNRNGYSDKLSLEYQAYNILNSYRIINENDLIGGIYTSFNDYYLNSPILITNNDNQYLCSTGLFDRERQQRLSLATLQALFNKEKEPLLNVGSFTLKTPVSFIVFGLILAIVLILMINRFKRFREYIFRAFLRPYNFYADIRDQRIMSVAQTTVIGIVMALILGMYMTSILNYYRTSELAQFVLMMLVPSNQIMEALFKIVWMPEISMLIISTLFFLFAVLLAAIIRIFALFVRARIYFKDTITISIWSGLPILFILPFAIVLTRILVLSPVTILFFLIGIVVILLWSILRMLRCTSVVFDVRSSKVYVIGFLILLVMLGIPLVIYQLRYSIIAYAQYFVEVMLK